MRVVLLSGRATRFDPAGALEAAARTVGMELQTVSLRARTVPELRAEGRLALAEGADALVAAGGDGTVHLAANLLAGSGTPLGVVPLGSGNDFARGLGVPRHRPARAIASIVRALRHPAAFRRRVDAVRIEQEGRMRWAVNSVNIGFDARVNRLANELHGLPGGLRYLAAIGRLAGSFRPLPFRIRLDGGPWREHPSQLITIGGGATVGGGIRLLPGADLADGRLDVLLVRPLCPAQLAALLPVAAIGAHRRLPQLRIVRVRRLEVAAPAEALVYADGEPVGAGDVAVECVPGALHVLRG